MLACASPSTFEDFDGCNGSVSRRFDGFDGFNYSLDVHRMKIKFGIRYIDNSKNFDISKFRYDIPTQLTFNGFNGFGNQRASIHVDLIRIP